MFELLLDAVRITNGVWSHYATMAVRTGGSGAKGLSLLVVPLLGHPGVSMRRMKTTGGTTSGTTFIDLEDVKVPTENLIGKVSLHHAASSHLRASSPISQHLIWHRVSFTYFCIGGRWDEDDNPKLQS